MRFGAAQKIGKYIQIKSFGSEAFGDIESSYAISS
jgi:hypothetical protein